MIAASQFVYLGGRKIWSRFIFLMYMYLLEASNTAHIFMSRSHFAGCQDMQVALLRSAEEKYEYGCRCHIIWCVSSPVHLGFYEPIVPKKGPSPQMHCTVALAQRHSGGKRRKNGANAAVSCCPTGHHPFAHLSGSAWSS